MYCEPKWTKVSRGERLHWPRSIYPQSSSSFDMCPRTQTAFIWESKVCNKCDTISRYDSEFVNWIAFGYLQASYWGWIVELNVPYKCNMSLSRLIAIPKIPKLTGETNSNRIWFDEKVKYSQFRQLCHL